MPKSSDISNPEIIKFLVESYDKTARLRMKWNDVHHNIVKDSAILDRKEKGYTSNDILKSIMIAGMPAIVREKELVARNKRVTPIRDATFIPGIANLRKGHSIPEVGLGDVKTDPRLGRPDTDLALDPKMRLMDPKQRKIIYKDKPEFGRRVYLKSRSKMTPDKKYYFRETSAWECGWRIKDSYFSGHAPSYPRVYRLTRDVMSLTGPQPDPPHYKSSVFPGPAKCLAD